MTNSDRPISRRPHSETTRDGQIVGCVDVAAQSGPRPGEFDRTRTSMLRRGIRAEPGFERGTERTERSGTRAESVSDKTALVLTRCGNRFGKFVRLKCRQITLQYNNIRD